MKLIKKICLINFLIDILLDLKNYLKSNKNKFGVKIVNVILVNQFATVYYELCKLTLTLEGNYINFSEFCQFTEFLIVISVYSFFNEAIIEDKDTIKYGILGTIFYLLLAEFDLII